jgi:signal transduction histidine kinase
VGQGEIVITGNFDLGMDQKNLLKYSLVELQNEQRPMLYVFQKLLARYSGRVQFEPGRISLGFPRYRWQDVRSADMLVEQIRRLEVEIEELEARLAKVMPERDERVGDFSLKEVIGLAGEIVARLVDEFDQIRQQATRQRQEADENQTTLWESCEAGSHFCQLLAANLLALEGECILSPRATDVGGVLESVRRMLRSKIEGIAELEWNVEADLSPVKAAETVLAQVLLNLALNSLEELARVRPSISRLSFAARETAGAIQIDISDTGEGLPAEVVERLFKEAVSTRRHVEGGIGLQVVRSILDDLGGDIEFHSTTGQGTRASITLPIWEGSQ